VDVKRLAGPATAAAVVAMVAWSAWNRWVYLTSTPFPVGVDGYFYAVQLRSIVEHGHLQYPASPLTFWLFAPFAWATDPVTGAKLGAAILGALVAVPAYFVGKRVGGSRATGLLAAALATPSAGSFYLSVEFVKNGVGLTIALTYVWLLLRACEAPRPGRIAAAAVALLAAFLAHKMAAGVALLVTLPAIAVEARLSTRHALIGGGIAGGVLLAAVLFTFLFPGRTLGGREIALVPGMFTSRADWLLPALRGKRALWMGHEALIGGVLGLGALGFVLARVLLPAPWREHPVRPSALVVAVTFALFAVVLALPWLDVRDPQGLAFRLRIAAFLPMAIAGAALAGLAGALVPRDVRLPVLVVFALVWAFAQPRIRDEGAVDTHPALAEAVQAVDVPDGAVVICPERHIVFMAAWYTHADVRLRPEGVPPERRWRLLPLAFIGKDSPLDDALLRARAQPGLEPPRGSHPRHPNGLVLVPEATWEWVLSQLPEERQARLRRWRTI
jgi:hypothetical protein